MNVEWLPEVEHNLKSQIDYIAEHNPQAAIDMGDAIDAAVPRLADYPEGAPLGRVPGTRELIVTGTPYIIVYRIERFAIVILRVLHGAQRWPT